MQGFHRTFATGAACQQRTLTPPDIRSCPTLGLACVLMSIPISPELVLSPDFWIPNIPRYFLLILTLEIWPLIKVMTHPWIMDNNYVKYYPDPTSQWWVMARNEFSVCVHCDLDLGDMTMGQVHDTPLSHGQQLCEILPRSNITLRSYGPDTDFGYVCTMTLTLEIWPSV